LVEPKAEVKQVA